MPGSSGSVRGCSAQLQEKVTPCGLATFAEPEIASLILFHATVEVRRRNTVNFPKGESPDIRGPAHEAVFLEAYSSSFEARDRLRLKTNGLNKTCVSTVTMTAIDPVAQ